MVSFRKNAIWLSRKLDTIAGIAIFAMMCLTCADVFLRLFRRPITGTYEIVSFLGVIAVSFAMAHTSVEKGHVAVDLLVQLFPKKVQGMIESIVSILGIILFGLIAWQSVVYGLDSQKAREVSSTLQFPLYPIIYGVALGAVAVCVVLMVDLADALKKVRGK